MQEAAKPVVKTVLAVKYTQEDEERFWSLVNREGSTPVHVPEIGSCWNWEGDQKGKGYGRFYAQRQRMIAHRAAYIIQFGGIPDGLNVLHRCDNPACVRGSHLFLGTIADNNKDRDIKQRWRGPNPAQISARQKRDSKLGEWVRQNRHLMPRGEKNGWSALKDAEVVSIRESYARGGVRQRDLAKQFNTSQANISRVILGKSWAHV